MKKITIAVIGTGRIGKMHTENIIQFFPDVTVKAVVNPIPQKEWASKLAIPIVTTDCDVVFDDPQIKAVIIATSSNAHVDLIKRAAAAGKHIFCEKPVAFEPEKIKASCDATNKANVVLQVGYNRRFDPDFLSLKNAVQAGEIGRPHIIRITNRDPKRPDLNFIPRSGGLFLDFSVHDFDMARFLTGSEIDSVYATGAALVDPEIANLGDIDTAVITLKLKNGTLCVIDCSRETHYGYDQRVEVFGSKGSLQVENLRPTTTHLTNAQGKLAPPPLYSFVERYKEAYINQFKEFFQCIDEQRQSCVTGYDAMQAVSVALAAKRSFEEKRMVLVE